MSVLRQERRYKLPILRAYIVEFGDLGTLSPSFKSKIVPQGEVFNVQKHIEKPVVRLSPSKKYFTLTDVIYEQAVAKPKKGSTKPTPQPNEGGGSNDYEL